MELWVRLGAVALIAIAVIAFLLRPRFFRYRKPNDYQHSDYTGGGPGGLTGGD